MQVDGLTFPFAVVLRQVTRLWWLPQTPRERLARLFFKPERQKGHPFRIRRRGGAYLGDFGSYLDWRVFFLGDSERESQNLCLMLAAHAGGRCFADIGANKGLYTVVLAKAYSRVIAFEPDPAIREQLNTLIAANRLTNVSVRDVALGEQAGEATFYAAAGPNRGVGSLLPINEGAQFTVPVRTGDEVFADTPVGMIKLDVEGFEAMVLAGMRRTLHRDRPFLLMEIGDTSKGPILEHGGLGALLPPDYSIFEVSDHTTAPKFFLRPLSEAQVLERRISNNLLCPKEKVGLLERHVRRSPGSPRLPT